MTYFQSLRKRSSSLENWIKEDLAKSGLTNDEIQIRPLLSEVQLQKYLGRKHFNGKSLIDVGGYFIEFPNCSNYQRLKLKTPIGKVKYIAPDKCSNRLYIPKQIIEDATSYKPDHPIFITEGEKKSACATKHGYSCIGLAGVYGYLNKEGEIEDFKSLNLSSRKVYIVFDNDIGRKTQVKQAEMRLAVHVINKGGEPFSVRLPNSDEKIGLDDYLVKYGAEKFKELIENAKKTFETHIQEETNSEIILKELSKVEKLIVKEQITKGLANQLKISPDTVRKQLSIIFKKDLEGEKESKDNKEVFTDEELEKAKQILESPNLLKQVLKQVRRNGYVGELINIAHLYLSFTSRLFDEAISNVVKGDSASGKSFLVKAVLNLFPKSEYHEFTAITPQSLFYLKDITLSHKVMVIFESHGSEKADYSIRSSLSEGELKLLVPQKNPETNSFETKEISIPANGLSYVETTTKSQLHTENQTRLFDLYLDQSEKQTKKILFAKTKIIDKEQVEKQNRIFQAMQTLLNPFDVYIPYDEYLAMNFPFNLVRIRRDFPRFLILIKTICLLHQYQRDTIIINGKEYLKATVQDYEIAYNIAKVILVQTLKELTPRQEAILKELNSEFKSDSEKMERII